MNTTTTHKVDPADVKAGDIVHTAGYRLEVTKVYAPRPDAINFVAINTATGSVMALSFPPFQMQNVEGVR